MSPIQEAMCKVIRESGLNGIGRCAECTSITFDRDLQKAGENDGWVAYTAGAWTIDADGHTLTQEEYEAWEKQQS